MTLFRSILLLAGVAAAVSFALFSGHALSVHSTRPALWGLAGLGLGIVLLAVYARSGRDASGPRHS